MSQQNNTQGGQITGDAVTVDSIVTVDSPTQTRAVKDGGIGAKVKRVMGNKLVYRLLIIPLTITIAALLRAVSTQIFVVPYNFAPGGITGVGALIQVKTGFNAGYTILILNVPLVIISYFFMGKRFAFLTGAALLLSSGLMIVIEYVPNIPRYKDGEPILAAVASGVLSGLSIAMLGRIKTSMGGTEILAYLIQKKLSATNVAWFVFGLDAIVIFASYFVYDNGLTPILLSFAEMFCFSKTSDVITSGFKSALKFEIVTKNPEELSRELLTKLNRGVTMIPAVGMYSHDQKALLICVIRKRQLSDFYAIIKKYPGTFAYVTSTSEVVGEGFSKR